MNAEISVIVPTANRISSLDRFLVSLQALDGPLPETIVIQNGIATDPPANQQMIQRFDRINLRIIDESIPGQLAGRHRGLHESSADILVFVDDDVVLSKTWLIGIREAFEDPRVSLVGGPCLPEFESPPPDWLEMFWQTAPGGGRMLTSLSLLELEVAESTTVDPNLIWGLNFAIRRSVLRSCGGFHPDCVPAELQHFQGDGETGLSRQIAAAGDWAVYHPSAAVHHRVGCERMTPQYFDQRYFYQGVCDSYTHSRMNLPVAKARQQPSLARSLRSVAARLKHAIVGQQAVEPLAQRFSGAYQRGFDFHQQCVARSPLLRRWVQRADYFDYQYPVLETDFVCPERQVTNHE